MRLFAKDGEQLVCELATSNSSSTSTTHAHINTHTTHNRERERERERKRERERTFDAYMHACTFTTIYTSKIRTYLSLTHILTDTDTAKTCRNEEGTGGRA